MPRTGESIALQEIAFQFREGEPVLRDVSFCVHWGETVAVLGENGVGKTTLLSLCLGFLRPSGGRVTVGGEDPWRSSRSLRSLTAYVPEVARIYPHLTGSEVIAFFGSLSAQKPAVEAFHDFLGEVGFPLAALARPAGSYSKGMRQKLTLALGLLKGARIFVLDEPTSGLDPAARRDLSAALKRLADGGSALLLATHDLDLLKETEARPVTLENGIALPGVSLPGAPDLGTWNRR